MVESGNGFGRGWIPAGRDIGLPGEGDFPGGGASAPLPLGGRVGGGHGCDWSGAFADDDLWPTPNPSRLAEGLSGHCWTPALKARFLHLLADAGNVRAACAAVGLSAQSAYVQRRRDAVFARGWAAALVLARDHVGQVLADRALHGVEEAVWFRGERVGVRRRFDSRLLLAHVARLDRIAVDEEVEEET